MDVTLGHRLRRWPNITSILEERLLLIGGLAGIWQDIGPACRHVAHPCGPRQTPARLLHLLLAGFDK